MMVKSKKMKKLKEESDSSDSSNVPYDDDSDMDTDQESDAECLFCTEHYSKEQHGEKWIDNIDYKLNKKLNFYTADISTKIRFNMSTETGEPSTETKIELKEETSLDSLSDQDQKKIEKLYTILSEKDSIELHLKFHIRLYYADLLILKQTKQTVRVAVSDVNDDVESAAVTAFGFLLFRTPKQCPIVVSLLAEKYNAHVYYGAAMALSMSCVGTGLRVAIALLGPMSMFYPVNFVRWGALIASAMILIQQSDQTCLKVTFSRQTYAQVVSNKHEDVMPKFKAILAQRIINAGRRNVTLLLQSRTGHANMLAAVGTLVFT
ncbi:unnamed protein product [Diabrotica balteata]|uniref:Uncharacterized protein n=1 Tax=Diabrotica balteata TaxID=107213 RepID=A0A9N9T6U6_DIABA|nr:unnamed protein product [Diabrotica balteata]